MYENAHYQHLPPIQSTILHEPDEWLPGDVILIKVKSDPIYPEKGN